jgi:hypothetical protein
MTAPVKARAQFLAVNAEDTHLAIAAEVGPHREVKISVDVSPSVRHQ